MKYVNEAKDAYKDNLRWKPSLHNEVQENKNITTNSDKQAVRSSNDVKNQLKRPRSNKHGRQHRKKLGR